MFKPVQVGDRKRYSYARINDVWPMPHLIDIQNKSYEWFIKEGLVEIFHDISPITDFTGNLELSFENFSLDKPKRSVVECKERSETYAAPMSANVRLLYKDTGEIKESTVFMGDFPLMTETGTFVINGAERVIVSQLVRSPGFYVTCETDPTGKKLYSTQLMPNRGAWIEFETDASDTIYARVDRTRKLPATTLLKAFGLDTEEKIIKLFGEHPAIMNTLEKDTTRNQEEALIEVYKKLRPGEPALPENARTSMEQTFFDPKRYDLANVGRYKLNKKLGWKERLENAILAQDLIDESTGELIAKTGEKITLDVLAKIKEAGIYAEQGDDDYSEGGLYSIEVMHRDQPMRIVFTSGIGRRHHNVRVNDVFAAFNYLLNVMDGYRGTDDIDHLGNRRVRCVGELLQNQFRIGLSRMERVVRERMQISDTEVITPQSLINIRPVTAAIKEFFGSSQLSQFMDQNNPLAELTHKRRLSALGPGGLSRERAGYEVRDVHNSHYGRMCPIETPEGPNIGLIGSLSSFAVVNQYGFMETPYRKVDKANNRVTDEVYYMTADEEDRYVIAQANEPLDENGFFLGERVTARKKDDVLSISPSQVDYMDVSPKQVVSIATALIPFLENDDANRALMGANMQRQAVPLLCTQAPIIGTGMEFKVAVDSGVCVLAKRAGEVIRATGEEVQVRTESGEIDRYELLKFKRSNQGTCINQRPIVHKGDIVAEKQVLADGPASDHGELALGHNVIVAYMPWEGYNYEDAILLNEDLIKADVFTSVHIEEYECESRDTKLGREEITREIPNVSEEALKDLDEDGIICIGAEVRPGDILVGKVTPKGETELTAEERLLRAIFGEKAREVRDSSLRVPHGEAGKIVSVKVFKRENGDELSPGINEKICIHIAQKRKISEGDKMAGRHGNKGVVSRIMAREDMPFLPTGEPVHVVLNPLGVPSRMNIGQVLENHLGWAARALGMQIDQVNQLTDAAKKAVARKELEDKMAKYGYDVKEYGLPDVVEIDNFGGKSVKAIQISVPVFDGAKEQDLADALEMAGISKTAKTQLYDGRTGEPFDNPTTVGLTYMLKLHHLVDDKIHARSTGPYSLVTQQPLGGKAQFGGQRFGEMEVWALEAYGAAYTLQEILTVKSDDTIGRVKTYEAIVKGENVPQPGIPESFKVLVKELQSIGLDIKVLNEDEEEISLQDEDEDDIIVSRDHDLDVEAVVPESQEEESDGYDENPDDDNYETNIIDELADAGLSIRENDDDTIYGEENI
ncbi:MAG: DNA-directed RNA polymerase subunit beta [Phascolarctobacterium sp.]|nr:DNA-directed RNA polymerase subunit beta [Phascolarctobacterium sp.]